MKCLGHARNTLTGNRGCSHGVLTISSAHSSQNPIRLDVSGLSCPGDGATYRVLFIAPVAGFVFSSAFLHDRFAFCTASSGERHAHAPNTDIVDSSEMGRAPCGKKDGAPKGQKPHAQVDLRT